MMAKELYIPVNGFSKKTSKFYAPVIGFSKEIVKAYCSVNGFSKLFYEKGGGGEVPWTTWWYETQDDEIIRVFASQQDIVYKKTQKGIAYFGIIKVTNSTPYWEYPVLLSTDINAVYWTSNNTGAISSPASYTYNNETWYYAGFDRPDTNDSPFTPNCLLGNYSYSYLPDLKRQVVDDFLYYRIYNNNFKENYQAGRSYDFVLGETTNTLRKALGIFLFKNVDIKGNTSYDTLLDNVETIVNHVKERTSQGNYNRLYVTISVGAHTSDLAKWITISIYLSNLDTYPNAIPTVSSRATSNGYDYMRLNSNFRGQYGIGYRFDNNGMTIQGDGTVSPYQMYNTIGCAVESSNGHYRVSLCSIGLDL